MQSRALAVALLLALLALLAVLVYVPGSAPISITTRRSKISWIGTSRYLRVAAQRKNVEANIAFIAKRDASRYYLKASSRPLPRPRCSKWRRPSSKPMNSRWRVPKSPRTRMKAAPQGRMSIFQLRGQLPALQKALYGWKPPCLICMWTTWSSALAWRECSSLFRASSSDVLVQFELYAFTRLAKPALKKP